MDILRVAVCDDGQMCYNKIGMNYRDTSAFYNGKAIVTMYSSES